MTTFSFVFPQLPGCPKNTWFTAQGADSRKSRGKSIKMGEITWEAGPMSDRNSFGTAESKGFADDLQRWHAVETRDKAADGAFVYAVTTTGIYCRPSCSSRRPKRENVRFYNSASEAEADGYRACRKCLGVDIAETRRLSAVETACALLDAADENAPTLEALANATGLSRYHLQRTFKTATGVTPRQYWDARRLDRLRGNLKSGEAISSALYGAGYGSSSRLYEKAHGQLGMTPATYGKGGRGAVIAFTLAPSPLGHILIAATESGICYRWGVSRKRQLLAKERQRCDHLDLADGD